MKKVSLFKKIRKFENQKDGKYLSLPDLHSLKDQSDQEDVETTPGLRTKQLN